MNGPYPFNEQGIHQYAPVSRGVYVITGKTLATDDTVNYPSYYVGRTDDIDSRLRVHLSQIQQQRPTEAADQCLKRKNPPHFFYEVAASALEAYQLECIWYHKVNPTCNSEHPKKNSPTWRCPELTCPE